MIINGREVDRGKFIGKIKVRADGKVQVVTETTDGNESIMWASWEYIKQVVEDVLAEALVSTELPEFNRRVERRAQAGKEYGDENGKS